MPPSNPRLPVRRAGSYHDSQKGHSSTPLDPLYQQAGASLSQASMLRPPFLRHDSRGSPGGSRSDGCNPRPGSGDDVAYDAVDADQPLQVTENAVAAVMRLDARMRELEDVMGLVEEFEEGFRDTETFPQLLFYFVDELLRSYYALRHAWAEIDDLREHRYGTAAPLPSECDAAAVVQRVEAWKHQEKKQRKQGAGVGAAAGTGPSSSKSTAASSSKSQGKESAEEAKCETLRQMRGFAGQVRTGMKGWKRETRREDLRELRRMLFQELAAVQAEQRK